MGIQSIYNWFIALGESFSSPQGLAIAGTMFLTTTVVFILAMTINVMLLSASMHSGFASVWDDMQNYAEQQRAVINAIEADLRANVPLDLDFRYKQLGGCEFIAVTDNEGKVIDCSPNNRFLANAVLELPASDVLAYIVSPLNEKSLAIYTRQPPVRWLVVAVSTGTVDTYAATAGIRVVATKTLVPKAPYSLMGLNFDIASGLNIVATHEIRVGEFSLYLVRTADLLPPLFISLLIAIILGGVRGVWQLHAAKITALETMIKTGTYVPTQVYMSYPQQGAQDPVGIPPTSPTPVVFPTSIPPIGTSVSSGAQKDKWAGGD